MNKPIENVNSILDKASDFKYFALLGSFIFFLDYTLILSEGIPIHTLSYKSLASDINVGKVLIFFCGFTFLVSFVTPFFRSVIRWLFLLIPIKWYLFFRETNETYKPDDWYRDYHIKHFSIKTNNPIAYRQYEKIIEAKNDQNRLEIYCLALLITTGLNWSAYLENEAALFSWFIPFLTSEPSFFGFLVAIPLYAVIIGCLYVGIIEGGNLTHRDTGHYYLPKHGFNNMRD